MFFDRPKIEKILSGGSVPTSRDTPEGFIAFCKEASAAEAQYKRDELALENRSSMNVRLMRHGSLANRNEAILTSTKPGDNWKPEIGSELQLTKGNFTKIAAPAIPGANEDRGWIVRVTSIENDGVHGILLNDTTRFHGQMH